MPPEDAITEKTDLELEEESLQKLTESSEEEESRKAAEEKDLKDKGEGGEEEKESQEEKEKAEGEAAKREAAEKKEGEEEEEEEEDKVTDLGEYEKEWIEAHPHLKALNINSFDDLDNAYKGGLKGFEEARRILGPLEKEIPELKTEEGRKAFLERVKSEGKEAIIPKTPTEEFTESRRKTITDNVPKRIRVVNPDTGEYKTFTDSETGEEKYETRDVTSEETEAEIKRVESECNKIFPVKYVAQIHDAQNLSQKVFDDSQWQTFRLKALFSKLTEMDDFKDLIIPDDNRQKIMDFFDGEPEMANKIVTKAIKDKKNHWEALHHVFTTMTKSELIQAKIDQALNEKKTAKEKKEKETRGEIDQRKTSTGKKKPFEDLSLTEMDKNIEGGG